MSKYQGLYEYRKIIASERACLGLIRRVRWPRGVRCPRCGFARQYHFEEYGVPKHQCKRCDYKFSDLSQTIFQRTKLPLSKWVLALALFKIGLSAHQLAKEIGVSYKTAWQLMHKFRSALENDPLISQLRGTIELDETYFGGRQHRDYMKGHTGMTNKIPVVGIRSRDGKVKTLALSKLGYRELKAFLRRFVRSGSLIYTDDLPLHDNLYRWGYRYHTVNKRLGFVRPPDIHTNSVEGYWMLCKNKLYARHHQLSRKYLPKYLAEMEYKFNCRYDLDFVKTLLHRLIFPPLSI